MSENMNVNPRETGAENISYFDMHCDTAGAAYMANVKLRKNLGHADFLRMSEYKSAGAFFAVWVVREEHERPFEHVKNVIAYIREQAEDNCDLAVLTHPKNYIKVRKTGKIAVCVSVEGGDALEGKIDNIVKLKDMGVTLLTLTWNNENALGRGAYAGRGGLTGFGKSAVRELENAGIIVDTSHLNDDGFRDICSIAKKPFVISHSDCRALCGDARNASDRQIRETAERGGVIGLNLYQKFLNDKRESGVGDILAHAEHIMNTAKSDSRVSIGTDFDGMKLPARGINGVSGVKTLAAALKEAFGEETAEKILWKNAAEFFRRYYN